MKKIRKKMFVVGLTFSMILSVASSFALQKGMNQKETAVIEPGDIICTCTSILRGRKCKANANGADCAPTGTTKCWEYDRNC